MPSRYYEFDWDENNVEHIARHGLEPEEVEQVFTGRPLFRRITTRRMGILGRSFDGRYLVVFFEYTARGVVRIVTARPMTDAERRRFLRHGG